MGAHSDTGASGSKRWLDCAGSVVLAAGKPSPGDSDAAFFGTCAHAVSEYWLEHGKPPVAITVSRRLHDGTTEPVQFSPDFEMLDFLSEYVEYVQDLKTRGIVRIEQQVTLEPFDEVLATTFGTADTSAVLLDDRLLISADLKYGKGRVSEKENPQAIFYAVGIYLQLTRAQRESIDTIRVVIAQPRVGKFRNKTLRHWDMPVVDLLKWALIFRNGVRRVKEAEVIFHEHGPQSDEFKATLSDKNGCGFCQAWSICPIKQVPIDSVFGDLIKSTT